jgi:hypothetical protein
VPALERDFDAGDGLLGRVRAHGAAHSCRALEHELLVVAREEGLVRGQMVRVLGMQRVAHVGFVSAHAKATLRVAPGGGERLRAFAPLERAVEEQ